MINGRCQRASCHFTHLRHHSKLLHAEIAQGGMTNNAGHDVAVQVGVQGTAVGKQVNAARLLLSLIQQPHLPQQAGHGGNRFGQGRYGRFR